MTKSTLNRQSPAYLIARIRTSIPIVVLTLVVFLGCSSKRRLERTDVLGESEKGKIVAETWYDPAPLSPPMWRVCLQAKDATNREVLFIVESVFQESDPGFPHLVVTNGAEIIRDIRESYVYSLSSRNFVTNVYSFDVYAGDFVPAEKRVEGAVANRH